MVVVGQSSVERTFLQAVNRIIRKIGENEISTVVNNQSKRINIAMAAVEDARDEVYYHTNWDFKRGFFDITLAEDQMWYALPDDHEGMGTPISLNRKASPIFYKAYEDLMDMYPDLRSFPPGSGIGGINSATQLAAQTLNFGEPDYYTTWGGYAGLMPIPNEAFVTLEVKLYSSYWKHATVLSNDLDDIPAVVDSGWWSRHEHLLEWRGGGFRVKRSARC